MNLYKENDSTLKKNSRKSLFGITEKEKLINETRDMALKAKIKLDKDIICESPPRLGNEPSHTLGFKRSNTPLLYSAEAFGSKELEHSGFREKSLRENSEI